MKKQIIIPQACVEFLFSIVNTTPAKDRSDIKKMHTLFEALKEPMNNATTFRNETRKKYLEKFERDGKEIEDVPAEKMDAFQDEIIEGMNKKVPVTFDREAFSFLKTVILEKGFETNPNLQNGLSGSLHIRLFTELTDAVDKATEVK